jgi:hypothetical protein
MKPIFFASIVAIAVLCTSSGIFAQRGTPTVTPTPIDDSQLQLSFTTVGGGAGGATVLPTTRTIPHWWGATLDPQDGITYGYNMVGADPNSCSGDACDVTVEVDVTPIDLNIDGMSFRGSDVLDATLASPQFALNDYGFTPYATTDPWGLAERGPGGALSQEDAGVPLQLLDAMTRAQFGKTGASTYHLRLHPNVQPTVTIDVPQGAGFLFRSGRGVVFAGVEITWFEATLQHVKTSADPTHLALYLTDDTIAGTPHGRFPCWCIGGFHGVSAAAPTIGGIAASAHSNGNAPVQTFAWTSYTTAGLFARPDGGPYWAIQDILALSHELSEWANDPFVTNVVGLTPGIPGFPQYGCRSLLETGDPAGNGGFAIGTNTFRQGPNPNGSQSADGYYHPEDVVTLPWFLHLGPNLMSEPTQTPTPNLGRYTFMGTLEHWAALNGPPPKCG